MADQLTNIDPMKAFGGKQLYGFSLLRQHAAGFVERLDPLSDDAPSEVILRLNPTSLQMDEPFATSVTPTQGGVGVESRGSLFKECVINGNVGFLPSNGGSIEDRANQSGYADFLRLRNLFRRYALIKAGDSAGGAEARDPEARSEVAMMFLNFKDNEFWIAEPMSFSMPPRHRLSYTYSIRMRLIDAADYMPLADPADLDPDPLPKMLRSKSLLERVMAKIGAYAFAGVAAFAKAVGAVIGALAKVTSVLGTIIQVGLDVYNAASSVIANLRDAIGGALKAIDGFMQVCAQIATIPADLMDMVLQAYDSLCGLAADARMLAQSVDARYQAILDSRDEKSVIADEQRATTRSVPTANGATAAEIMRGESIFSFARRVLKDVSRWTEIVALNDLQPPYIVDDARDRRPGVMAAGDAMLVPANVPASSAARAFDLNEFDPRKGQEGMADFVFGTDIALDDGGDLVLDARNDLALVSGSSNMAQAMNTKLGSEQGSLPRHPWFGFLPPTGTKGTPQAFVLSRIALLQTLKRDKRVAGVERVDAQIDRDRLYMSATVRTVLDNAVRTYERAS